MTDISTDSSRVETYDGPIDAIRSSAAWVPTGFAEIDDPATKVASTVAGLLDQIGQLEADNYLPEHRRAAALAEVEKTAASIDLDGISNAIDAARADQQRRLVGDRPDPTAEMLARQDLDQVAGASVDLEELLSEDVIAARLMLGSFGDRYARAHDIDPADLILARKVARSTVTAHGDPLQKEAGRTLDRLDNLNLADLAWAGHATTQLVAKSRARSRATKERMTP